MKCVLCANQRPKRQFPEVVNEATFVVNGTSVCDEHADWMLDLRLDGKYSNGGGDTYAAVWNYNCWLEAKK